VRISSYFAHSSLEDYCLRKIGSENAHGRCEESSAAIEVLECTNLRRLRSAVEVFKGFGGFCFGVDVCGLMKWLKLCEESCAMCDVRYMDGI
jgi:hypothetical protein